MVSAYIAHILGYILAAALIIIRLVFQKRVTFRKRLTNFGVSMFWFGVATFGLYLIVTLIMQFIFGSGWFGFIFLDAFSTAMPFFFGGAVLAWLITRFIKP